MQQSKPAKLAILLCLILLLGAVVPVHALTTCQQIQQTVNNYLTSTYYAPYCKYNSTTEGDKIKIYLDCDRRFQSVKVWYTDIGGVHSIFNGTAHCSDPADPTRVYEEPYTVTYYKEKTIDEFCDGHITTSEGSQPFVWCMSAICGGKASCNYNAVFPITHPQSIDCNSLVSHIYQTSLTIPSSCNLTDPAPAAQQPHELGPACGNSIQVNSSSNLKSGNYYHTQSVISKPTSLPFELYYNSLENSDTPLGKGWSHTYNLSITEGIGWLALKLPNGDITTYTLSGTTYQPDPKSGDSSVMSINSDGTYKRTLKDGTIQTFNVAGKLSLIKDLNGVITSLYYNGSDLSSMYKSAVGAYLTTTTTNGRITTIKDTAGRITTFGYTGNLLTSVTGPAGDTWQYVYDANGRMIQKTDPLGYQSSNSYDASGKLISSTDPEGKTKSVSYDPATNTSTITEKDGSIWHQQYDPAINAATAKTDPLGNITRYSYDTKGNLLTKTAPNGATTSYTYDSDSNSNPITEADPLGNVTRYSYNSLNLVTSITDPKGNITSYTYDTQGNLTSITDPSGAVTSLVNNTKGYVTRITDPRGGITTILYDSMNNPIRVTNPLGKAINFTYDTVGNLLSISINITDANNNVTSNITSYAYNSLNQRIKITDPKGNITQLSYDFKGNLVSATDAKGNPTSFTHNYRGQTTGITDALNHLTQLQYGATGCSSCNSGNGKLSQLTDALNNSTSYQYDTLGRLQTETDPLGNSTSYQYDSVGNLTQMTNPNNTTINYRYDANNRLIEKTAPEGTTSYQYDQNNNLTAAANPFISYSMTYDTTNRLTRITDANNNSISYQYDSLGNKTATITPTGATINYSYDAANHLTTIATSNGSYSFTYDAGGRRTKLSYPSNTNTSYTYDNNNNLTDIKQTSATNSTIADTPYSYDTINNRITKQAITYNYDPLYQLISASGATPESYSYDALGNRQGSYQHNAANQTLSSPQGSYSYDTNGNQTSRGTWSQTWNSDNQLITTTNGTVTVTFKYDPFGRRIEKTTIDPSGTTTYRYLYDGPNIIQETRTTGTATETTNYLHGPNIDEPLGMERNNQNYYFHQDGLGSIIAITDASGQKVQSYSYDSFGNITAQQNTTFIQPFAYTGRIWDAEIGLYDYRLRTYDPVLGKFISKDPLSFAAGDVNLYRYVGGNVTNFTDPSGLIRIANGMMYDDNGNVIDGQGLEAPNPFLDPVNYVGGIGGGIGKLATSSVKPLTCTVSRWGKPGLEAGDWVMKGGNNWWNYLRSFKWQPGFSNEFAPLSSGASYTVPTNSIKWPTGWGPDGWFKGLFGQRRYMP